MKRPNLQFIWQLIRSFAFSLEAHLVVLLGTRPCLLCEQAIAPAPLSLVFVYQSRFLCLECLTSLKSDRPIFVTLNLPQPPFAEISCVSICPYQGKAREAIRAFKYGDKQELVGDLAKLLEEGLQQLLKAESILIAVPLHQKKLEERGFNQSELIAAILAKRTKIKCANHLLIRHKVTTPQYGLTKAERALNVEKAFLAQDEVKGKHIILVDDVLTSGATALACAAALLEAGAVNVSVLTIARALLRSENAKEKAIETLYVRTTS